MAGKEDFDSQEVTLELLKQALKTRLVQLDSLEKKCWAELNCVLGMKEEASFWLAKLGDLSQIEASLTDAAPDNAVPVEMWGKQE